MDTRLVKHHTPEDMFDSQNIKQLMGEKSIRCVRQCMRANLDLHVNEYLNEGHYTHCEFLGSINLF